MPKYLAANTLFLIFCVTNTVISQQIIYIQNPSFENKKALYQCLPGGWFNCGDKNETPPDIHGKGTDMYGVQTKPRDGNNFLGMVTRSNKTWECVGQQLSGTLRKGKKYTFKLDLCKSLNLLSVDPLTLKDANFNVNIILRIQGSHSETGANEILAKSEKIKNKKWKTHTFILEPNEDYDILILEAFYPASRKTKYVNGNIMLDNCSNIEEIIFTQ